MGLLVKMIIKLFFQLKTSIKIILYANKIFERLKNKGVLLAICSKNNFEDVENFSKKIKRIS